MRYGPPLWPCSGRGRSRARVLDIPVVVVQQFGQQLGQPLAFLPLARLKELAEYWHTGYDWRGHEAELNELPHFSTEIDGQNVHFVRLYDIRHWSEFERGGHFAAMEVPELLAGDVRDFVAQLP
jgi:hypothetical protein